MVPYFNAENRSNVDSNKKKKKIVYKKSISVPSYLWYIFVYKIPPTLGDGFTLIVQMLHSHFIKIHTLNACGCVLVVVIDDIQFFLDIKKKRLFCVIMIIF